MDYNIDICQYKSLKFENTNTFLYSNTSGYHLVICQWISVAVMRYDKNCGSKNIYRRLASRPQPWPVWKYL